MEKKGFTIIDRREQSSYWKKDIDITACKGKRIEQIEVKWDSVISRTGNLFFELITDIQRDKKGWATYTEADYIFYGDAQNRLFYIFPTVAMRDFLREHIGEYETSIAKDYDKKTGEVKKESLGAKVPLSLFRKYV